MTVASRRAAFRATFCACLALATLAAGCAGEAGRDFGSGWRALFAQVPPGSDADLRIFYPSGAAVEGVAALSRMQLDATLILWLARDQAGAMADLVQAFQRLHPDNTVAVVTLAPELLRDAILSGGLSYELDNYPGLPDLYASTQLADLQALKRAGFAREYAIYLRDPRRQQTYSIAALVRSRRDEAARLWLKFLRSAEAHAEYARHGYAAPAAAEAAPQPIP